MFIKGYRNQQQQAEEIKLEDVNAEFWENVQPLKPSEQGKRTTVSFLTKKEKMEQSIQKMKDRQTKLATIVEQKKRKLQSLEDSDEEQVRFTVTAEDMEILRMAKMQQRAPMQQQF